ncbi:ABC-2 transporter permease [Microbacterium sp. Gd 4-13]|uniref:ABC-2 transporter permease n=1 Tax=Microbacterium sp. Gd 4-13 TaxID=2173179 RepID=UPI001401EE27|nr:ABC-2 transporter permease [Microbacterium sp. Gd 4-13]
MTILKFARFDLASWLPRKQTILPLAFIVVVAAVLPVPGMAVVAAAFVASIMLSAPFLGDERGRLETLYGILPVSRGSVVFGRTLAILVFTAIAAAIALAATAVVALVRGDTVAAELMGVALAAGFAFIGLAMALQLPVLFRIGYARGRLVTYAPALAIAAFLWLNQALGLVDLADGVSASTAQLIGAGVGLGLAGVVVGALLATRLYRTRELR